MQNTCEKLSKRGPVNIMDFWKRLHLFSLELWEKQHKADSILIVSENGISKVENKETTIVIVIPIFNNIVKWLKSG